MSYVAHLTDRTTTNTYFRTVLHTTKNSQLVSMCIPVGEDIGEETHARVEQILSIQSGVGKTILDGVETVIGPGDVVIVPPGTMHNIINTGSEPLLIVTVYVPPNHIDGTVHKTKADALADEQDEAFGESVV